MELLFDAHGYKLYETCADDSRQAGVLGNKYAPGTVLLFEGVENDLVIGNEIAWAISVSEAEKLAYQLKKGERNVLLAIRADQAEAAVKLRGDKGNSKKGGKKGDANSASFIIRSIKETDKLLQEAMEG